MFNRNKTLFKIINLAGLCCQWRNNLLITHNNITLWCEHVKCQKYSTRNAGNCSQSLEKEEKEFAEMVHVNQPKYLNQSAVAEPNMFHLRWLINKKGQIWNIKPTNYPGEQPIATGNSAIDMAERQSCRAGLHAILPSTNLAMKSLRDELSNIGKYDLNIWHFMPKTKHDIRANNKQLLFLGVNTFQSQVQGALEAMLTSMSPFYFTCSPLYLVTMQMHCASFAKENHCAQQMLECKETGDSNS